MRNSVKEYLWFLIHNHRRNRVVARLARLCKNIHRASEHGGFDINVNGERAVLTRSLANGAPTLFDVGANVGNWTAMAKAAFPDATVHAFEIDPDTACALADRHGGTPGVYIHPFGLAASEGTVPFYAYSREASELTSLRVPLHSHVPHRVQTASVHTGERVCRDLNIERIDFLKVDVEGADYDVLTGFSGLLDPNHIGIIQFEHEGGRYLHDFYALLAPKGYAIGKIYANYVDFRPHHAEMEHCPGPNYLAVPVAQQALIDTLKKGWAFRS